MKPHETSRRSRPVRMASWTISFLLTIATRYQRTSMKLTRAIFSLALSFLLLNAVAAQTTDNYQPGPDSKPQEGVPKGEVLKFTFDKSKIFPGTTRDYWVYVPAEYKADQAACVYV